MSKGLKRHPCLKPLSRDHLVALMGAQRLGKASCGDIALDTGLSYFKSVWDHEISQHLEDEERILPEFIKVEADLEKLLSDHQKLREYRQRLEDASTDGLDEKAVKRLAGLAGSFLDEHVRWEERFLFPRIESTNSPTEIVKLLHLTEEVEKSRVRGKSCEPRKNSKKWKNPDKPGNQGNRD